MRNSDLCIWRAEVTDRQTQLAIFFERIHGVERFHVSPGFCNGDVFWNPVYRNTGSTSVLYISHSNVVTASSHPQCNIHQCILFYSKSPWSWHPYNHIDTNVGLPWDFMRPKPMCISSAKPTKLDSFNRGLHDHMSFCFYTMEWLITMRMGGGGDFAENITWLGITRLALSVV